MDADLFASDPDEPLDGWFGKPAERAPLAGTRLQRFEYASRGDRVPGRLLLPARPGSKHPLVLLQHGAGGSKESPYLDAAAGPWVRGGAAVASIDFPLHGERASTKLSARLLAEIGAALARAGGISGLWVEFVQQAVCDLRRALDALSTHPELETGRCAYAGFSMGTILGASFCGADPRPRAAALAIGGGGFGPSEVDPVRWIGRFAPRPVLFVNASRDERVPRAASEALFAAAGEPKEIAWFDCGHSELPGAALKAMWIFLRRHLSLAETPPASGG
jgi:dienelactone hydrolase